MLMPFCTEHGEQFIEVDLLDAGDKSSAVPESQHSGFCLLCFSPATPGKIGIAGVLSDLARSVPTLAWNDPELHVSRAWTPVLARAPPAGA